MIELSTNQALAGVTAVIIVANIVTIAWLWNSIAEHVRSAAKRRPTTFWKTMKRRAAYRVAVGFMLKALGITVIFAGRMPLRAIRESGNEVLGVWWLHASMYWEFPAMAILLCGLGLVMYPAVSKYGWKRIGLVLVTTIVATFLAAAWFVDWLATAVAL